MTLANFFTPDYFIINIIVFIFGMTTSSLTEYFLNPDGWTNKKKRYEFLRGMALIIFLIMLLMTALLSVMIIFMNIYLGTSL